MEFIAQGAQSRDKYSMRQSWVPVFILFWTLGLWNVQAPRCRSYILFKKAHNWFVLEFQKQVPETLALYGGTIKFCKLYYIQRGKESLILVQLCLHNYAHHRKGWKQGKWKYGKQSNETRCM